jgi:hypothetical protein
MKTRKETWFDIPSGSSATQRNFWTANVPRFFGDITTALATLLSKARLFEFQGIQWKLQASSAPFVSNRNAKHYFYKTLRQRQYRQPKSRNTAIEPQQYRSRSWSVPSVLPSTMKRAARQVESDGNWIAYWVRYVVLDALVITFVIDAFIHFFIGSCIHLLTRRYVHRTHVYLIRIQRTCRGSGLEPRKSSLLPTGRFVPPNLAAGES